jgi:hypothetical protein
MLEAGVVAAAMAPYCGRGSAPARPGSVENAPARPGSVENAPARVCGGPPASLSDGRTCVSLGVLGLGRFAILSVKNVLAFLMRKL